MSTEEIIPVPKPSIFILGPALSSVFEPMPIPIDPNAPGLPGRRQVSFRDPATTPGGNVNLQLLPPATPEDVLPINVYAFFVQPISSVPDAEARTPDWFFKSGAASGSIHIGAADANGAFTVTAQGVKPSLDPYFVQVVLEFQGS